MKENNAREKWTGYSPRVLGSLLSYLKKYNPKIWNIYDEKGEFVDQLSEANEDTLKKYNEKGYAVKLADNKLLIEELENGIKQLESQNRQRPLLYNANNNV
jgi:hypothetical protein